MPVDTLLGIPKEYAFLLIGLIVGGLLGGWIGRAVGLASAASRLAADEAGALAETGLPRGVSLVVNGRNIEVSATAILEIQELMKSGKPVEAVKALRAATGLGLEEAKAVLDSLEKVRH